MKKVKPLFITNIVTILISFISLIAYHNKGNDFFTALSSILSEATLILSFVILIYALVFCCNYLKESKITRRHILYSILILLFTTVAIFISFINVYSHRNIFEYVIRVINKKENLDIVKLFIRFLSVYYYIYVCSIIGMILCNFNNKKDKKQYFLLLLLLIILVFVFVTVEFEYIYLIIAIDIITYLMLLLIANDKLI